MRRTVLPSLTTSWKAFGSCPDLGVPFDEHTTVEVAGTILAVRALTPLVPSVPAGPAGVKVNDETRLLE